MKIISDIPSERKITLELSEKEFNTIVSAITCTTYDNIRDVATLIGNQLQVLKQEDYQSFYESIRNLTGK
jgi:hypothetical protein